MMMMPATNEIRERYLRVREQMDRAARSAGRDPAGARLIVVTKTHPVEMIQSAIEAGAQILGENYAEEAVAKIQAVSAPVEWHMIGHVQSRKADLVAQNFHMLHALDGLKLANRLDRFMGGFERKLPILLECNVSGEASKFGYAAWDEARWPALLDEFSRIVALAHLEVRGLMTMPPYTEDPETARPHFVRLRRLQAYLAQNLPQAAWMELSMGTSADFIPAIQEGATFVRVGTAIMGARKPE
jgi:hypothetical protein